MNVAVTNVTRNKRREAERSSKLSAVKIPKQEDMLAIVFNTCASVVLFSVQNASSFLDSVPAQAFAGQIPAIYWDLPWSPLNNRKKNPSLLMIYLGTHQHNTLLYPEISFIHGFFLLLLFPSHRALSWCFQKICALSPPFCRPKGVIDVRPWERGRTKRNKKRGTLCEIEWAMMVMAQDTEENKLSFLSLSISYILLNHSTCFAASPAMLLTTLI